MSSAVKASFALLGDHNPQVIAHKAIPLALQCAAEKNGQIEFELSWLPTPKAATCDEEDLAKFSAFWCVPASPYASMEGALRTIRYAREHQVPFLGTCGGFQHAIIEFARNVLGHDQAAHAETHPEATVKLITPLECSLTEKQGNIRLASGSRIRELYGSETTVEQYHCRFGVNPSLERWFDSSKLRFTGHDDQGEVRIFELSEHPFFFGTLFQPERAGLRGEAHPLIGAFLKAALSQARLCFRPPSSYTPHH